MTVPGARVRIGIRGRRSVAAVAVAVGVTLVLAACGSGPRVEASFPAQAVQSLPADTARQAEDAVRAAMAATGASGAIVGVWAPWSGEWVEGVGTTAPGSAEPITTDMTFRVGQITRAMTCDAVFRVAERGLVALDDSVSRYVSSFPSLQHVTLRQLCDGSSGLGSYSALLQSTWFENPGRDWDPRELASFGVSKTHPPAPASYADSDAAYVLLGLVLERVTGKHAADALADEVFHPLGLDRTALPRPAPAAPTVAGSAPLPGYAVAPGADCTAPSDVSVASSSFGFTDSGVVSDIDDLATYTRALSAGSLFEGQVDRFTQPLIPFEGAPSWVTTAGGAIRAGSMIGQFGSIPGYTTGAFADPVTGLTVVVVLGASGGDATVGALLAWELAAIASKAAPAPGHTAPEAGLPWTAQQFHDAIAALKVCPG